MEFLEENETALWIGAAIVLVLYLVVRWTRVPEVSGCCCGTRVVSRRSLRTSGFNYLCSNVTGVLPPLTEGYFNV
jgi:hypothetical protein